MASTNPNNGTLLGMTAVTTLESFGNSTSNASRAVWPAMTDAQKDARYTCNVYDFIIEAVFMGALCVFGFCGNTLSILCLNRDKSKTATPFLLVSLELADTFFLITVLILRVLTTLQTFTMSLPWLVDVFPYMGKYVFPCAMISEMATIYLTLLVTVNRYISVCRPYEVSDFCSARHARRHVIVVVAFAMAYNVPRFFEYDVVQTFDERMNKTILINVPSSLFTNHIYQIVYSNVLYFLVMFCVPLIILIILNARLIKALRKTKKKRAQLLNSSTADSSSRSEDDITLVLIVVVLVFVVCQTPALVTQLLIVILPEQHCPNPFFYYERISDLMVVANSSANFIIYCFCSRKFRQILVSLLCKNRPDSPEPSHVARQYKQVPAQPRASVVSTNLVVNGNTEAKTQVSCV
ncbi:hypothetical protein LSH36_1631g00012 [Paralvinella palmiformis]|uniref:G-protein coupled receptors family 1 profile domain-containing protein n=1 Tax=Paralvinella palmiformis TaxID=53620 RepID=A0AAD9ISK2_9ANNE|nr:hypothetical protein LSH36_1631g00012 [Paralvinella palmiformis]